jgi:hypothetical protein
LIGNDYEMELVQQRTGRTLAKLLDLVAMVVTTLGRRNLQGAVLCRHRRALPAAFADR